MQRAKQRSGYHGKRVIGHAVWQAGYHDRVLRSEADTPAVVAYVLANPVRAGLVENPGDYSFSGSGSHTLAELLEYVGERGRSPS